MKHFQDNTEVSDFADVEYAYTNWQVLGEYEDGQTYPSRQFVYGVYIDEPLVMDVNADASGATGNASCIGGEDARYFYHAGQIYSVAAMSDASGVIVEGWRYDPYGRHVRLTDGDADGAVGFDGTDLRAPLTGSSLGNPYTFTGRRFDPETQLHHYRNRYYDSRRGRFISRDPIGYVGGINLYGYVNNMPTGSVDPMGKWDSRIHKDWTRIWADEVGFSDRAQNIIANADEGVDSIFGGISPIPILGDQSYHFDVPFGGNDSRLDHFDDHFKNAVDLCNKNKGKAAAKELGKALHPLQDYVAHGDHGRFERPITTFHNIMSPQTEFGNPGSYPDDPDLDALGAEDGRPVGRAIQFEKTTDAILQGYDVVYITRFREWAWYIRGHRRFYLTQDLTKNALYNFKYATKYSTRDSCGCSLFDY